MTRDGARMVYGARMALASILTICTLAAAARPARVVVGRRPLVGAAAAAAAAIAPRANANPPPVDTNRVGVPELPQQPRGLKLKNGLKFTDGTVGPGEKLRWGQVVNIKYVAYTRESGDAPLKRYDASDAYLVRHGNGRDVRGLDEGIHTMRVGGTRRVEVPPSLGYTAPGLGPMPESAGGRRTLDKALDDMAGKPGAAVVYDVAVLAAWTDDADAGYYADESFSGDEIQVIVGKAEKIGRGLAKAAGE